MQANNKIVDAVSKVYRSIDSQVRQNHCDACGKCCDFQTYDHQLFVTSPELIYFAAHIGPDLKPMTNGRCPYNIDEKCSAYPHRFAGCRIFSCKSDKDFQSRLTESAINDFKSICRNFNLPYRYTLLATALNQPGIISND